MKLARIELLGFKSFADKTVFDFSNGVTAILGPNGCGKSNVVDAVKWVLGEQSARSLRGGEMADVIFAGSENRKPMGMAEVSLVFDNSDGLLPTDYREVCVTRRLYRSGESEYRINRNRCRLRDVRELFMDTGIGTSAYSFIEQGKVEAMLSAKPHERRLVFEEAAGISKYKTRRKEALGRLDRTEQYLVRVNDIVEEVEKRTRSVSRQAANARRFQRLSEELDAAKGKLYAARWRDENARREAIRARIAELQQLRQQEESRGARISNAMAELQQRENAVETRIEEASERLSAAREGASRLESEKARLDERLRSLDREETETARRADAQQKRQGEESQERQQLLEEKERLEDALAQLRERLDEAASGGEDSTRHIEELEKRLEDLRRKEADLLNRKSSHDAARARFESELEGLQARQQTLQQRRGEQAARLASLKEQAEALAAEAAQKSAEEERLVAERNAARDALQTARRQAESAAAAVSELQQKQSAAESRLRTLQELESSMAGMHRGVKAALEAARNGQSVCSDVEGVVAELFTAGADHAVAIETALGGAQQNLVTRTAEGARRAIEYLKREKAGRATFLPLDRIRPRKRLDPSLARQPGVVGEAIDLVRFDESHRAAAEYLLAGTLVVETLDQALALGRGAASGVRMVTLEGDLVSPSGAMTGGREQHQKGGLVTRRSELETLSAQAASLEEDLHRRQSQRDEALASVRKHDAALTALEAELEGASRAAREVENRSASLQSERNAAQSDAEAIETELGEIATRLESTRTARERQEEEGGVIVGELEAVRAALAEEAPRLQTLRAEENERAQAVTELKVTYAKEVERLGGMNARLQTIEKSESERNAEIETARRRVREAAAEKTTLTAERDELEKSLAEALSAREDVEGEVRSRRETLSSVRAELESRRGEERALTKRMSELAEALNGLQLDERERTVHMQGLEEKAREELAIEDLAAAAAAWEGAEGAEGDAQESESDAEDADDGVEEEDGDEARHLDLPSDPDALEARVTELQEKIRRIGPVNHQAIEELAELRARGEFLQTERGDLMSARDDIQALLEKLNHECRKRFDETFHAVRENFQLLFRQLFGGGKADLVLEESEDPLNAGIEVIARPPGKEPASISLLSGGEKALCAVALLFAIFRSKPSPFCILDEVDGPLDESNIDRYMTTLDEFARESQFIIITHSKRTMSMVGYIYGVTQSEPGVSRNMSLRFDHGDVSGPEETIDEVAAVGSGA